MMTEPVCTMCGKPEVGHRGVHPFTPEGVERSTDWLKTKKEDPTEGMPSPVMSSFPFDPVLRQALINKGVLTPEDLTSAEAQIKVIGGMLNHGH